MKYGDNDIIIYYDGSYLGKIIIQNIKLLFKKSVQIFVIGDEEHYVK